MKNEELLKFVVEVMEKNTDLIGDNADLVNHLEDMAIKEEAFSEALFKDGNKVNAHCRAGVAIGLRMARKMILSEND